MIIIPITINTLKGDVLVLKMKLLINYLDTEIYIIKCTAMMNNKF